MDVYDIIHLDMKLEIFVSKLNRVARDEAIRTMMSRAESSNERFVVIAPETLSLSVEKKCLEMSARGVLTNVEVMSFVRLFNALSNGKYMQFSSQTGTMLVKKIILENLDKLVCFKKTARSQGFVEEMYATIQQLKSSKISPTDLMAMQGEKTVSLRIKMQDIIFIYAKYEEYLADKWLDDAGRLNALATLIESAQDVRQTHYVLVGHENWTSQMKAVIKLLVRYSKGVIAGVSFAHPDESNGYITENECLENLKAIGDELGVKYTSKNVDFVGNNWQRHMLDNLFAYPYHKMSADEHFEAYEAKNPTEEVEYIASIISREVIDGGARYKDFAVACANIDAYAPIIHRVFAERNIPVFVDQKTRLDGHFVFSLINTLFNVVRKNFDADEMILLSKNVLLGLTPDDMGVFENYIVKYGINHNDFKSPFWLGANGDDSAKAELKVAEDVRSKLYAKLAIIAEEMQSCGTFDQYADEVVRMLELFDVEKTLAGLITAQQDMGYAEDSMVSSQVLEKLGEFIRESSEMLKGESMDVTEFLSVLFAGIGSIKIALIPVSIDEVFVGDILKCEGCKRLFVIGMQEGAVPLTKDDCGIISDTDIDLLSGDFHKKIEPSIRTVNRREKWKFFQGVLGETESLNISYSLYGFGGGEDHPSSSVRDMLKLFDGMAKKTREDYSGVFLGGKDHIGSRELAFHFPTLKKAEKELVRYVNNYKNNVDYPNHELVQALYFATEKHFSDVSSRYFDKINQEESFETIDNASNLFFPEGKTSISQVETYFDCPFKHFISYGLRARERDEANIGAMDVGTIIHSVCERFAKYLKQVKSGDIDVEKVSNRLLSEVLDEESYKVGLNEFLRRILVAEAKRVCKNIYDEQQGSEFHPEMLEAKFGAGGVMDAVKFDKTKVVLQGKIDRVDSHGGMLFAVDYKTGSRPKMSLTKLYYGKQSQLFIYLKALEQNRQGVRLVGAFYMPVRNTFEMRKNDKPHPYRMIGYNIADASVLDMMDNMAMESGESVYFPFSLNISKGDVKINGRNTSFVTDEELAIYIDYVKNIVEGAITEIESGFITPTPLKVDGRTACEYCDCRWICRAKKAQCTRETKTKNKNYFKQE